MVKQCGLPYHKSMNLLEKLAPHDTEDGPDTRSFWERLWHADEQRSQNPNTLWSSFDKETRVYWELISTWQWLCWGFGINIQGERARTYCEGHLWISIDLGPYGIALQRTTPRKLRTA
jgi:hypothetical protein